jgi:photosystem II stability/assembly factor-like uncharacterized protein
MAVDPKSPQVIYAGFRMNTYQSGPGTIMKSIDGGVHWASAATGDPDSLTTSIAINPQDTSVLYALGNHLYKSTDGAASWQPVGFAGAGYYTQVLIRPDNPEIVYLGGAPAIPFSWSADAGKTWNSLSSLGSGALAVDSNRSSTLYATPNLSWVDRSDDGGTTWTRTTTPQTAVVVHTLVVDKTSSSRLYAGTANGLFVSNDSGAHWSLVPGALASMSVLSLFIGGGAIYAGTDGSGVYKSSDSGVSWIQQKNGLTSLSIPEIVGDPSSANTLYAGTRAGVSKTGDGGSSWSDANIGIVRSQVHSLAPDPATPGRIYAGTEDGLFRSDDHGLTWDRLDVGFSDPGVGPIVVDPSSPQTLYAALRLPQPSGPFPTMIIKSTDRGGHWQPASVGFPTDGGVSAMVIDPSTSNTILVATFGNGIYKSTDGAQTWHDANQGLDDTIAGPLVIEPEDSSILYAGTSDHLVYKTVDGGSHWSQLPTSPYRPYSMVIDSLRHRIIAGVWGGNISMSDDGGATWNKTDAGLPSTPTFQATVFALANNRSNPDLIFAAVSGLAADNSDGGVFESTDGGITWAAHNAGLSNYLVNTTAVDAQGVYAYAGTQGGVFSLTLNTDRPPISSLAPAQRHSRVVQPRP